MPRGSRIFNILYTASNQPHIQPLTIRYKTIINAVPLNAKLTSVFVCVHMAGFAILTTSLLSQFRPSQLIGI